MTWDEGVQARYGEMVLAYFRSGFNDLRSIEYLNLRFYGPTYELLLARVVEAFPEHWIDARHLTIALTGLVLLCAVIVFSSRLDNGIWLCVFSAIALLSMPRFIGHLFNNSKDIPFAAGFCVVLTLSSSWLLPAKRDGLHAAILAVVVGFVAGIRPGGLPLMLLFVFLALVARMIWIEGPGGRSLGRLAAHMLLIVLLAWATMIIAWPWAHLAPLSNPLQAITQATSFHQAYPVLYDGNIVSSDRLPADYLFRYLLITTPPVLLVFSIAGVLLLFYRLFEHRNSAPLLSHGYLLLWISMPLLMFWSLRPNTYDGIRHILFLLPAIAICAALSATALLILFRPGRVRWFFGMFILLLFLMPVRDMVRLHPYQSSYFNILVGGLSGAQGRYETDYWVSSYRQAMLWINQQARSRGSEHLNVLVAANHWSLSAASTYASRRVKLIPLFERVEEKTLPPSIDYYLSTYRYQLDRNFPDAPVVYEIARDGARFAVVKGR